MASRLKVISRTKRPRQDVSASSEIFECMSTQHSFFPALKKPYAFAHQGGELLAPTNTMIAFENALAIGYSDFLDIDVHMTKDGHLVGIHDATVDRTTNG